MRPLYCRASLLCYEGKREREGEKVGRRESGKERERERMWEGEKAGRRERGKEEEKRKKAIHLAYVQLTTLKTTAHQVVPVYAHDYVICCSTQKIVA